MQMRVCAFFADVCAFLQMCVCISANWTVIRLLRWTLSCFVGNPLVWLGHSLVWSVIICSVIDRNQISRHNRAYRGIASYYYM